MSATAHEPRTQTEQNDSAEFARLQRLATATAELVGFQESLRCQLTTTLGTVGMDPRSATVELLFNPAFTQTLPDRTVQAIIAHELAHAILHRPLRRNWLRKQILVFKISWHGPRKVLWREEFEADAFAARWFGTDILVEALSRPGGNREDCATHPSNAQRIQRLAAL